MAQAFGGLSEGRVYAQDRVRTIVEGFFSFSVTMGREECRYESCVERKDAAEVGGGKIYAVCQRRGRCSMQVSESGEWSRLRAFTCGGDTAEPLSLSD